MAPRFLVTSGNLLADRRFEYAQSYLNKNELDAALDILKQTSEIVPYWPVIPFQIGCIFMNIGKYSDAVGEFKKALILDPEDYQGCSLKLQQCQGFKISPTSLPEAFVKTLFDQYAPRFDEHLLQTLEYKIPQVIFNLKQLHRCDYETSLILDLGCGTGLAAEFFAPYSSWMVGVDISAGMLSQASQKQIYNELIEKDLLHFLKENHNKHYDLVLAADVFTYFGDLQDLFTHISHFLLKGGLFAFSVQSMKKIDQENIPYFLEKTNRFNHNDLYIDGLLAKNGLKIIAKQQDVLRLDRGKGVNGLIYLCEKENETLTSPTLNLKSTRKKPNKSFN